ncbi:hypothetical protein EHR01_05645 [Leptospira mtsangambouensis]|uniref:Transferase n=1 Tax=Leptospira mtsangambouensis TaxID=2484912 RepID=A0ABY2P452_9LEPT|nr:hypothetical protein [Leptospira mtsangambouensis]TGM82265.1 hypothetical protein EHR01_05645 [Leptospira mtsangambouensis]
MQRLFLNPKQFEKTETELKNNLFIFPSAFLDRDDILFQDLNEESLLNLRLSIPEFDKEFVYLEHLIFKLFEYIPDLFNEYYSVSKSKKYWTTLLLPDLREVLEVVYLRYLQLKLISNKVEVEVIQNSKQLLKFDSSRLFILNVNFISNVDWALSSFILLHSDLRNKVELSYVKINEPDKPRFKNDREYYDHVVSIEKKRISSNKGNLFPYYVSFPSISGSIFLGTGIFDENLQSTLNSSLNFFSVYYKGLPVLSMMKKKKFFSSLSREYTIDSNDSFETFFVQNIDTFFPEQFFKMKVPVSSNIKLFNIGLPGATILDAESRENGGLSFGIQHGTAYGMYTHCTQEWNERLVSDGFITWGWSDFNKIQQTIPLPSPHLSSLLINQEISDGVSFENFRIGIIFNTTYNRLGKFLRVAMPFFLRENILLLSRILQITNGIPKKEIIVSEYSYEQGYDLKYQLSKELLLSPDITFESMAGERLIQQAELVISNSFGTSFFERLVINKPIIIFNDFFELENYNSLWSELSNRLIDVGIYELEESSFQRKIKMSQAEILAWWNSENVQEVRLLVLKKYAWADIHWADLFKSFIAEQVTSLGSSFEKIKVPFLIKLYSRVFFRLKGLFV